jgi:outer membrane protein OmpA-like peptidoglycan-associated protein
MMRWAGIALLPLLVGACAAKPEPISPTARGPELTNRQLMEALAREGVGRIVTGDPARPPGRPDEHPTEIRETPRGVVVTFRHVLFLFDSSLLTPSARREVERFTFVLNDPRVRRRKVTLEGHADAIGDDAYNMDLSRRRATTVADELLAYGLRRDRLSVEAYGERRPVAPNTNPDGTDNPAGRMRNRRVEAVIQN